MSNAIAAFEKVSYQQWIKDQYALNIIDAATLEHANESQVMRKAYDDIKLPVRATDGSAGYDFYMPYSAAFNSEAHTVIPTGIRAKIEPGWMLALFPRSGLGFKHGMRLMNTVGIIDSDYYNAANEGHIMAKIDTDMNFVCATGDRFIQGIFIPYGLAANDKPTENGRVGGFGSTGS